MGATWTSIQTPDSSYNLPTPSPLLGPCRKLGLGINQACRPRSTFLKGTDACKSNGSSWFLAAQMLTVPHHVPRLGHTLRVIVTYLWPTHKLSVAIAFLPPEVLHAIFELLTFSDHNTLSNCMRVCRRWHDIARLRFFAAVPVNYSQIERFHDLLRTDPGLAAHVREVCFFDELGQRMWRCFPEQDHRCTHSTSICSRPPSLSSS